MSNFNLAKLEEAFEKADANFKRMGGKGDECIHPLICASLDLAIVLQDTEPDRADSMYNIVLDVLEVRTEFTDLTFSAMARSHVGLGILKSEQAVNPDMAIIMDATEHFLRATDIYQQMGDDENVANTLLHLGPLHAQLGDSEEAFRSLTTCLDIRNDLYGPGHPLSIMVKQEISTLSAFMSDLNGMDANAALNDPFASSHLDNMSLSSLAQPLSSPSPSTTSPSANSPVMSRSPSSMSGLPIHLTSPLTPTPPMIPKPTSKRPSPRSSRGRLVVAF